jgi:hypothetical protein
MSRRPSYLGTLKQEATRPTKRRCNTSGKSQPWHGPPCLDFHFEYNERVRTRAFSRGSIGRAQPTVLFE